MGGQRGRHIAGIHPLDKDSQLSLLALLVSRATVRQHVLGFDGISTLDTEGAVYVIVQSCIMYHVSCIMHHVSCVSRARREQKRWRENEESVNDEDDDLSHVNDIDQLWGAVGGRVWSTVTSGVRSQVPEQSRAEKPVIHVSLSLSIFVSIFFAFSVSVSASVSAMDMSVKMAELMWHTVPCAPTWE